MAHYKPLQAGCGLWVVPSWCAPPEPDAVNIILDPGLAFGTGDHPTTSLCLAWLSEQTLPGKTLLDYGCGSGILSNAAIKLGAAQAYAVDIDPQALEVTRRNAVHNGIHNGMQVMLPSELPPDFQADIVIANHALVLHQAAVDHALGVATTAEEEAAPGGIRRIVFDEGHHLFDAADGAFSGHLTAFETSELRRWLRGPESERRRGRGLADRIGDLVAENEEAEKLMQGIVRKGR